SFILRFFYTVPPPPRSTLFPYTTLFRSLGVLVELDEPEPEVPSPVPFEVVDQRPVEVAAEIDAAENRVVHGARRGRDHPGPDAVDRKSTRLNSSHVEISYAVFCLKKKKN